MPRMDPRKPRRNQEEAFRRNAEATNRSNRNPQWLSSLTDLFRTQPNLLEYEIIFQKLLPIWNQAIEPLLIQEFGQNSTLYCIFYRDQLSLQPIMEVWDPHYVHEKPAQVFKLDGFRPGSVQFLPKYREQAEILILPN